MNKSKEIKLCPIKETLVYLWVCEKECDYRNRCSDDEWVKEYKLKSVNPTLDYKASESYKKKK